MHARDVATKAISRYLENVIRRGLSPARMFTYSLGDASNKRYHISGVAWYLCKPRKWSHVSFGRPGCRHQQY